MIIAGCTKNEIQFTGIRVKPPVATMQLGPAIFFSENFVKELGVKEGNPVRIINKDKSLDLRVYKFFSDDNTFAIHRQYAEKLGITNGENSFTIKKIKPEQSSVTPKPVEFKVENYKGNLNKWEGYAIGAPHGDCDNETGSVVKLVAENYGIPATAAYGCRLSYRGIWFDCNRPLMKEPKPDYKGVIPLPIDSLTLNWPRSNKGEPNL
jgi:hypothetical protein